MTQKAHAEVSAQLESQRVETAKTISQVEDLSADKAELQKKFESATEKAKRLEKENADLKAKKQARLEAERKAAQRQVIATASVTGTKADWLAASGIPQSQWGYVDQIVSRESGWNPNAVNPSSGACGLGQQLPCGKWAGAWNDPVAALRAMNGYVVGRYGSWQGAVAFWNANHWY